MVTVDGKIDVRFYYDFKKLDYVKELNIYYIVSNGVWKPGMN